MPTPRAPAFQSYAKDWRDVKVRRMSLAAQGAYRAILDDMWADSRDQCSVLDCDPFIAKSLGVSVREWKKLREEIQHEVEPLFLEKDGRLYSKRLKEEATKQRKYSKLQSERAHKRWDATVMPPHESGTTEPHAKSCSSSSSSDSEEEKKKKDPLCPPSGDDYGMARFWSTFPKNPRKVGKGAVEKWFQRHKPNAEIVEVMIQKLQQCAASEQWHKENGKFIPLPMTWLNQGRWKDEMFTEGSKATSKPPPPPPKSDPIGRGQWGKIYGNPKEYGYD